MKSGFISRFLEKIFHNEELNELRSDSLDSRRRIKELELDIEEKNKLLHSTKKEYELLNNSVKEDVSLVKDSEIQELFKELSLHLSQLNTMKRLDDEGKDVRPKDIFRLLRQVEKVFEKRGIIRIGEPGEKVMYDSSSHQVIGDFSPKDKEEVIIRFCGYKMKDILIKRALVGPGE